jgi:glycosyltransferase involved in cell wall biosynthesis
MAEELEAAGAIMHTVPMRRISTSHGSAAWAAYVACWPMSVLRLWRLARRMDVDVVHSNSLHCWYGWAVAVLARRPHLLHAREVVTQSPLALRVERWLAHHFAVQVLAVSGAVAAQLWLGNVRVVSEEADPAQYFPGRAGRARLRLGLADDALLVGYAGRIDTWKGLDVLLEAVPALRAARQGSRIEIAIAGAAVNGKEAYAASLRNHAVQADVRWLGPLSGPEAADLIADLDCLVLPSTEPEPWGLVLVEALACGTPVVATSSGGAREILSGLPPPAGRLVAPGDPAALASAVADLLPPATSTDRRRERPVLRAGDPPPYPAIFAAVTRRPGR